MLHRFMKLWMLSPAEIIYSLNKRLNRRSDWDYSLDRVLQSKKHMNAQYLVDRWERYWRVIENQHGEISKKDFDFRGKTILELGCGPVFGWGPMAIFLGAEFYYYNEPALLRDVVEADQIREQYFLPLFDELVANFGSRMSFPEFYEKIQYKCQPIDLNTPSQVDLLLSNSVLEHIPSTEIQSVISSLHLISKSGGYYFHSVDFGSHNIGGSGFGSIYASGREITFNKINRLRKSDIQQLFEKCGFSSTNSIIYRSEVVDRKRIHASWQSYSDMDLSARVVFFIGKKSNKI